MPTTTETPVVDESADSESERVLLDTLAAHRVLGDLITTVLPNIRVGSWTIGYGSVEVMLSGHNKTDDQIRAELRSVAGLLALAYDEKDHGGGKNIVTATGTVDSIHVRFWRLVLPACSCACTHGTAAAS